jgi:glycosyltransferase involved in cell wall biosynthesis
VSAGRIFFFNRYVYPDHSATSQLLTDLAWHLAERGTAVTLVGSRQRYDDAGSNLPAREEHHGVDIVRVGGSRFGRDSLAGRLLDYLSYLFGAARVLRSQVQPGDTVVMMTDPPLLGAALAPLTRWRGANCIHWLQDLFPEVAEELLGHLIRGWIAAPLRRWRNRELRRAARVVVISTAMATRVAADGVSRDTIEVVENWTDDHCIQPIESEANTLRREWGLEGKFVVGYSGNLGRAHDWSTMLDVATDLRDRADICFLLIGGGVGQHAFSMAAAARGLGNVLLKPYQPRELLAQSLSVPDVHWLSLYPSLEGAIFPSKLYGILAAGRPAIFVGDVNGEVASLLRASGAGVSIAVGDSAGGRSWIEQIAASPADQTRMRAAARAVISDGRSKSCGLSRWSEVLTGVPNAKRPATLPPAR